MCGVKLKVSNQCSEALEDSLELCSAALAPLQDVLIDARGKAAAAEARVRELEARLRWAQDVALALGEELFGLAGGARTRLAPPEAPASLVKAMEFCQALLVPLKAEHHRHDRTRADFAAARAELAKETQEREHLAEILQEAKCFCADLTQRFQALGGDHTVDAAGAAQNMAQIERRGSGPLHGRSGTGLYRESRVAAWEQDTLNCAICKTEFSMINNKKRRHHCRICGQCVCSACSPSTVQLKGHPTLQRACTPCISNSQRAPEMREMTVQIAIRLTALCGLQAPAPSQLASLPEALAFCETAVAPLEALLGSPSLQGDRDEEESVHARAEIVRLQRELGEVGARHAALRAWASWAGDSAGTLRQRLAAQGGRARASEAKGGYEDTPDASDNFRESTRDHSGSDVSDRPRQNSIGSDDVSESPRCSLNPFGDDASQVTMVNDDTGNPFAPDEAGNPFSFDEDHNSANPFECD